MFTEATLLEFGKLSPEKDMIFPNGQKKFHRLKFIKLEKEQRRGDLNIFKESGNIKAFPVLYKSMSTCFLNLREKFVIWSKTM